MKWTLERFSPKDIASLAISILALFLSGYSVYYTSFRPPKIVIKSGDLLLLSKQWKNNLHLFASVVMVNKGGETGWVFPLRLVCRLKSDTGILDTFKLYSAFYATQKSDGWLELKDMPVPELIRPEAPIVRNILFVSERDLLATQGLVAGTYSCDIEAREENTEPYRKENSFNFSLNQNDADAINSGQNNWAVYSVDSGIPNIMPDDRAFPQERSDKELMQKLDSIEGAIRDRR